MLNIYRSINTSEDRRRLLQIKQNAILEHQEREMKRAKANKDMNVRGEKYALEQVMELENMFREKIRLEKEHASKQAISEFVNAFNQSGQKENEWLTKQAEYRRKLLDRVVPDDLSRNELDPIWLRKKGDSLFQAGDYEAAVIAYTEAITQNPKLHSAYSNRAACHLQLRNYFKALEDSSMVLDLCVPHVAQNLKSRVRAHIRRGAAFCNLQLYKEGLIEYRAAQKLQPDDDTIRKDIENLEKFVNQE
ncbi:unnamed protein product [Schistosoma guineensis]|nr:unnamed protein product [Schistosoma guineensis]